MTAQYYVGFLTMCACCGVSTHDKDTTIRYFCCAYTRKYVKHSWARTPRILRARGDLLHKLRTLLQWDPEARGGRDSKPCNPCVPRYDVRTKDWVGHWLVLTERQHCCHRVLSSPPADQPPSEEAALPEVAVPQRVVPAVPGAGEGGHLAGQAAKDAGGEAGAVAHAECGQGVLENTRAIRKGGYRFLFRII